jgi:AraC-like DNA-binding protein
MMVWVMNMQLQQLNEIFATDYNLDGVVSVRQSWTPESRYNRLEVPRRYHGFFLLTDCPAVFELPDGSRMQAGAGDVVLLAKGAHYALSLSVPEGKTAHPIIVNFRITDPEGKEISLGEQVTRLCRDDGSLLPLFNAAARLYQKGSPAGLKAKAFELADTLFPIMDADECCIAYINRHYTNRFSVPELAQRCAVSETVYRKRFRQLTGLSPVQYINRLKIEKACQMLRSDDISPSAISDFLNFYSLPYFYKVFRDYTGMTPNQYREQDGTKEN